MAKVQQLLPGHVVKSKQFFRGRKPHAGVEHEVFPVVGGTIPNRADDATRATSEFVVVHVAPYVEGQQIVTALRRIPHPNPKLYDPRLADGIQFDIAGIHHFRINVDNLDVVHFRKQPHARPTHVVTLTALNEDEAEMLVYNVFGFVPTGGVNWYRKPAYKGTERYAIAGVKYAAVYHPNIISVVEMTN